MSQNELEQYIAVLDNAMEEAERVMLHEKAMRNESIVVTDHCGGTRRVAAKEVLAAKYK